MSLQLVWKEQLGTGRISDAKYDSELIIDKRGPTTNADLIITLKIYFRAVEPVSGYTDADHNPVEISSWLDENAAGGSVDFASWQTNACRLAAAAWNEKLWLRTPDDFDELDWPKPGPAKCRPNIHCGFRCERALTPGDAHIQVNVARLTNPDADFASDITHWDSSDTREEAKYANHKQITVAHEVGHALGLYHIGKDTPGCKANRKSTECYRGPDGSLASNIMGDGMKVTAANAIPWQKRMAERHAPGTKPEDWKAWEYRFAPRPLP